MITAALSGVCISHGQVTHTNVYLVSHSWHSGLVVPWAGRGSAALFAGNKFDTCHSLEIGWGDKAYYMSGKGSAKAVAWPTPSVVHVVCLEAPVRKKFPSSEIISFNLNIDSVDVLINYIRQELKLDSSGRARALGPGLYGRSVFYEGARSFWALRTCNTWAGEALRAGGVPINTFFLITAGSLGRRARKLGQLLE